MLTIKRAAELTGVGADTLRAWERRYAVIAPTRTPAGYRVYDEEALRRITVMRELIDAGWSARQAASHVLEQGQPSTASTGPPLDGLARTAADFDALGADRLLDDLFARQGFEQAVDGWLLPALVRLGDAWSSGRVSVAGEHLVSAVVQRRLAAAFEAAGRPRTGPRILAGLAPGCRHELGILAFAAAARRAGLDVAYLGADLPESDWRRALTALRPAGAVLTVPSESDIAPVHAVVAALADAAPDLPVYVGGAQQDRVGNGTHALGHRMTAAVDRLVDDLAASVGPTGLASPARDGTVGPREPLADPGQ